MKDIIDERDFKEKCARSIVKGYNVHFMTKEEVEAEQKERAHQIVEDARVGKVREIVRDRAERGEVSKNPLSNAELDNVTEEQIRKILGEKEERFNDMLEEVLG